MDFSSKLCTVTEIKVFEREMQNFTEEQKDFVKSLNMPSTAISDIISIISRLNATGCVIDIKKASNLFSEKYKTATTLGFILKGIAAHLTDSQIKNIADNEFQTDNWDDKMQLLYSIYTQGIYTDEQTDIFSNPRLSAEKIEIIIDGFMQGLSTQQVKRFSNADYTVMEIKAIEDGILMFNTLPEHDLIVLNFMRAFHDNNRFELAEFIKIMSYYLDVENSISILQYLSTLPFENNDRAVIRELDVDKLAFCQALNLSIDEIYKQYFKGFQRKEEELDLYYEK